MDYVSGHVPTRLGDRACLARQLSRNSSFINVPPVAVPPSASGLGGDAEGSDLKSCVDGVTTREKWATHDSKRRC